MLKGFQSQKLKPSRHFNLFWHYPPEPATHPADRCPYCQGREVVKRGQRQKKYETVQLYLCKACRKTFTRQIVKNKHYPLKVILDGVSLYNLGYTQTLTCRLLKEKYGPLIKPSTLANWVQELEPLCRYARLRERAIQLYSPYQVIKSVALNHRQVYYYRYHQAKLDLLFRQQKFSGQRFHALKEYLAAIEKHCPHQYFQTGSRSSQTLAKFDLHQVTVSQKSNHATRLAQLVLQAVGHNRLRHEALQQFMLANDSVTVAIEIPVFLTPDDQKHFTRKPRFQIPFELSEILTGHIDILQIRNGLIHILDYKPKAKTEKPYTQLTLYALALSRLTGLKLYDFKCAWFDEIDYFEFFPLHMVYKSRSGCK